MFYPCENQGLDFDDVRLAIVRFFGPDHRATIHDGDGCELFGCVAAHYCAGTVTDVSGTTVATFAIRYVVDEMPDGDTMRHVLAVSFGLPGQWCRNQRDGDFFDRSVKQLAEWSATGSTLSTVDQ